MLDNTPFYLPGNRTLAHPPQGCLLLHGLGGGVYEMQPLGKLLNDEGFGVKAILYPGHDQPSATMPNSLWEEWYQHALESYFELKQRYQKVSVIGFSTGCPLALHLAHDLHDAEAVDKLILLSPFMRIKQPWYSPLPTERYVKTATRFIQHVPRTGSPIKDRLMRHHATRAGTMKTFNLNAVQSALKLIETIRPKLAEIHNPTLIMQSTGDQIVDPNGAWEIMENLGSEHKELIWLNNSNHVITLDYDREEVYERIKAFLSA